MSIAGDYAFAGPQWLRYVAADDYRFLEAWENNTHCLVEHCRPGYHGHDFAGWLE